ncbi:unnamed protein product [Arabidopsis thaliana]|uniref:(thale cress) hypothetical protein n=1 Tax=Arabidopsis thaliana TaxID=3702 RepID=A0A7G2E149_ARATH|nr:unnamed protein product [Arabidopsis thaliana]
MESLGGIGFSNTSSATKKKRSTTLRRPWNDRQLQDSSSLPSTPIADNNENKIEEREAVESDEGSTNGSFQGSNQVRQGGGHSTASTEGFLVPSKKKDTIDTTERRAGFDENIIKKVKLKLGGSSKTINIISASDGASDIGLCSTKSSHASDDALGIGQTYQEISNERSTKLRGTPLDTASKSDSRNDTRDSKANTNPIRKSNRISKRRVLDEELDSLDDDDEEIQFLRRMKMAKVVAVEEDVDDDEDRTRKHKKLSKDDDEEEEEAVSDVELEKKSARTRRGAEEGQSEVKTEMTVTTRRRSGHSGNLIEFPRGLPPAPPRKRKENGLEVDQQLKKAEAAQRRKLQVEKAARESEAEAIRKILGQDSSRKKKEDKIKKRQEDKAKEKAADSIARRSDTVKWVMGPSGTIVTFPEELGLPSIFNSTPHSYPPPRERCAGPECTNPYKYRDSESNLPLCSLRCYKLTGPNQVTQLATEKSISSAADFLVHGCL